MRKTIFSAVVVLATLVVVGSCKNKEVPAYDVSYTFIEPGMGDTILTGEELHMEIDIQGTAPINNIEVLAINNTTGDTLTSYVISTTEQFYPFHEHIIADVDAVSECSVIANAWAANYSERITKIVDFVILP